MKKVGYVIIMLLLLICTSCGKNNLKGSYTINSSKNKYVSVSNSKNEISSMDTNDSEPFSKHESIPNKKAFINNKTPVKELLTKSFDIHYIAEKYFSEQTIDGIGTLDDVCDDIGVECLRETEAGALYSIHKIKQEGLLYIFYLNRPNLDYHPMVGWFYVNQKLSSKDFEKIQEGYTMDDVKKIDPATQIYENIYHANSNYWDASGGWGSRHYLEDGFLEFGYKNVDGKLTIFSKELIQDYQIKYSASILYPYDGHILPIDRFE